MAASFDFPFRSTGTSRKQRLKDLRDTAESFKFHADRSYAALLKEHCDVISGTHRGDVRFAAWWAVTTADGGFTTTEEREARRDALVDKTERAITRLTEWRDALATVEEVDPLSSPED